MGLQIFSCLIVWSAAGCPVLAALSDPGQPRVHTGKQQRDLEQQRQAREQERHLLSSEEKAIIELEQFSVTIGSAVERGKDEAEPAQSGLDHPGVVFRLTLIFPNL